MGDGLVARLLYRALLRQATTHGAWAVNHFLGGRSFLLGVMHYPYKVERPAEK
jgi:hypothetical protein